MNEVQWFAAYYQEKYSTHYSWNLSPPKIFVFSMMLKNDSWVVSTSGTEVYCTINCIFVVECWHLLFVLASPCHTSDKNSLRQINCPKGVAAGAYLGQVVRKLHIKSLYMFINCFCQMAAGTVPGCTVSFRWFQKSLSLWWMAMTGCYLKLFP